MSADAAFIDRAIGAGVVRFGAERREPSVPALATLLLARLGRRDIAEFDRALDDVSVPEVVGLRHERRLGKSCRRRRFPVSSVRVMVAQRCPVVWKGGSALVVLALLAAFVRIQLRHRRRPRDSSWSGAATTAPCLLEAFKQQPNRALGTANITLASAAGFQACGDKGAAGVLARQRHHAVARRVRDADEAYGRFGLDRDRRS